MKKHHWWGLGFILVGSALQLAGIVGGAGTSVQRTGTGLFFVGLLVELIGYGFESGDLKRRGKEGP